MIRSEFIKFTFLICILSSFLSLSVAVAQHDIEVLSVLAPGSGSNYVVQEKSPAGIDSQIGMYDSLPKNLSTLDESTLIDFSNRRCSSCIRGGVWMLSCFPITTSRQYRYLLQSTV